MLAHMSRSCHGKRPRLIRWKWGFDDDDFQELEALFTELDDAYRRLAAHRLRKDRAKLKLWIKHVDMHVGHRATKEKEVTLAHSASASKAHMGERNAQCAADAGADEWGPIWRSAPTDNSEVAMGAIEQHFDEMIDGDFPLIALPPFDPDGLANMALRVRASTGTGGDWLRLRHVAHLSRAARVGLGHWYRAVEAVGRWPKVIRSVIEIALTKRAGGARLIGLAASLYRRWARTRYFDIKAALEPRIARPELAAAPGRSATQAAFEMALAAEIATARGRVSATSALDISKYVEYIDVAEYVFPANGWGYHGRS